MTESMVERVAGAIWDAMRIGSEPGWEDIDDVTRGRCLREARAAIAAMREPTIAMRERAELALDEYYDGGKETSVRDAAVYVYQAMIGAALAEET